MQPPLSARPRPPARAQPRSTSRSKYTALPTPTTPRRRRSQLPAEEGSDGEGARARAVEASSGAKGAQISTREGAGGVRGALDAGMGAEREEVETLEGEDEPGTPPSPTPGTPDHHRRSKEDPAPAPVPFPTAEDHAVEGIISSVGRDGAPLSAAPGGLSVDEDGATIDVEALRGLSREELEGMLKEADRIIREKEQELSTFTAAGEELLNEFNHLRQRHESLVGRTPALGAPSPQRSSRNSTISSAGATPTPAGGGRARRAWRTSLGFPPPSATPNDVSSTPVHHRRISSGLSYRHRDPSGESSPTASFRIRAPSTATPDGSPTATRRRFISSSSALSPFGASKSHLSPTSAANELASLNQVNYSLTLQLSELHAESELIENEGRKKLRKLERELQAVREDLERAEHRNAVLETEAEVAKERENELARSTRAGPTPRRPAVSSLQLDKHETLTFDWRVRPAPFPDTHDEEADESQSPIRNFGPPTPLVKDAASDAIFSHQPSSPPPVEQPVFPSMDTGLLGSTLSLTSARPVSRSVSSSSLAPLPLPMQLDPSLEAQADALIEQLMQKIDELQDTNEIIAHEREIMEHRLELAQEEVVEWQQRCEVLEEEAAMARLGWDGPMGAIEWRSEEDEDADADTDAPVAVRPRGRRITRRSRLLTRNSNTPTSLSSDVFSGSTGGDSPTPSSSPQLERSKRTLGNELGGQYEHDSFVRDGEYPSGASTSSMVVHSARPKTRRSRVHHSTGDPYGTSSTAPPVTTADDLLAPGSLRWAGHPDAETYDQLEQAAEGLVPAWADDDEFTARSESPGPSVSNRRLGAGAGWDEAGFEERRGRSGGRRAKGKGKGKSRADMLASFGFGSDYDEYDKHEEAKPSSTLTRRTLALRRLGREASTRSGLELVRLHDPAHSDEECSSGDETAISSTYDELNHPLTRTSDYYPLALRSRYHPRMLTTMMADSAVRHVVTLITWIRFLIVLGMALGFALWQGPKKTLGLVDGRRRLR
ncbi:hypothetical protein JCM10449v2_001075 [Rhodotorula kratochvilovae]